MLCVMIGSFKLLGCFELSTSARELSRGVSDLTDNQTDASTVDQPRPRRLPADQVATDQPYQDLPRPVNDLIVTVMAPAAALSQPDGQIRASGMDGLFVSDVRALTEVRLRFGGVEPHPLTVLPEGPGRARFVSVAHGFGDRINDPTIRLDRIRQLTPDGMREEIRISSVATRQVQVWLTVELRCDLTPLELARRGRSRPELPARVGPTELAWASDGITVLASGVGAETTADGLRWLVRLDPGGDSVFSWRVAVRERRPVLAAPAGPVEWANPTVRGDDPRLTRLLARSLEDLESLRLVEAGADPGRVSTFIAAGAPWFLTLFGRDSIWAARMLLPLGTELAEGTLRTLARRQGSTVDYAAGEAPGKIMHELRRHDARLGRDPYPDGPPPAYYGSVDATPLWISLLADAWRWGLPDPVVEELLPNLRSALRWLEEYGDPDGDGFVEYIDVVGTGLANQGWKDSFNAVRFHDGTLGRAPIALCEVQAYAHRAALDAAALLDAFGVTAAEGERWRSYAQALAARFRDRFWVDGALGPYPAMAIDGDARPVDALTSNIGHLLGTGLLNPDEERQVARLLTAAPLAGGYGLRTMSTLDNGFSALSYHGGSIWPHDTAIALLGLTMGGADGAAATLIDGLLSAAEAFDYRLPELYGGDARADVSHPVPYPGACRPQAWAAAAAVVVLQAALGLAVDLPAGDVRLRPLGQFGPLEASGLRIAGRSVSIAVDRTGAVRVSGVPSPLRVTTGPDRVPVLEGAD
jgi:glycogen debranching enzyme